MFGQTVSAESWCAPRGKRLIVALLFAIGLATTLAVNVQGSCVVPVAGLIGWWPGDGSATDIAGTNNGGLQGGATANAVGLVGQAFSFDGTNGFVQIPDSPVLRPTNLTVEAWVLFSSLDSLASNPGHQYIVFKQNSRGNQYNFEGFGLGKDRYPNVTNRNGDVLYFNVSDASGTIYEVDSAITVQTGIWYHVAGVRGTNFIQLYVNGVLQGQTSVPAPQDYGNYPLFFGTTGQPGFFDGKLAGRLDEVSLYNRALSSAEIAAIYAAGTGGKCKAAAGPVITAQPANQNVIAGSNALFAVTATGMASLSYQWRFNGSNLTNDSQFGGVSSPALSITNAQPANAGSYSVVVTNSAGSATSAVAALTVLVPPVITAQPQSLTNVTGTTAIFSAAATGSLPLSYQWQLNGVNLANGGRIGGATTNTLTIANAQATDAGNYTLVVSNTVGSATSAVAVLAVLVSPVIIAQPANQNVVAGSNAFVAVTATGTASLSYQWRSNGSNLTNDSQFGGVSSPTLSITNAQPGNAGGYSVVVTNSAGSATSAVAVLTVLVPPTITAQPQSLTNVTGTTASFSASATGSAPLSYQWQFNGVNLATGNSTGVSNTWEIGPSMPLLMVEMSCVWLGDKLYVTGMTNAWNPAPTSPMLVYDISSNTWAWLNPDRPYTGNHHAAEVFGGRLYLIGGMDAGSDGKVQIYDPTTNGWSLGAPMPYLAGACSSAVINGKIYVAGGIAGAISGSYSGYNTNAAAVYDPGSNIWTSLPPVPFGMNHTASATDGTKLYLFGGRAIGNAPDNGYNTVQIYDPVSNTWVSSSDPGSTLAPLPQARGGMGKAIYYNGEFYVMGGETVSGSGATTNHVYDRVDIYNVASNTWRLGTPMPTARHGIYPALRSNRIYVAGGGVVSGVSYSSLLEIYVAANGGRISGATSNVLTITNVQPADVGNYTLVVSNTVGSVTSAVAVLTVLVPPAITAQPQSLTNVTGTTAIFGGTATGSAPLNYQWQLNGVNLANGGRISGAMTNTLTITNVQATDAGNYTLAVTNSAGSVTSVVAALTVLVPPDITAQPTNQNVVAGSNTFVAVTATGTASLSYQWRFNGTNLANGGQFGGVGSPTLSITNAQPGNAGSYSVVVTNSAGSVTSAVAVLAVLVPPVITAQPQSLTNVTGTTASFSASATGSAPVSYQWQFNGVNLANSGRISGATTNALTIANVQATNAGNYTLVVSNIAGAVTSVVATLAVTAPPVIESIALSNGVVVITWSAVSGRSYRLQFKEGLASTNWNDVLPDVLAVGPVAGAHDGIGNAGQRFYRVLLVP